MDSNHHQFGKILKNGVYVLEVGDRCGARNFPIAAKSSDERLKYGLHETINAENLRGKCFSPSNRGLTCSDGGL